MQTTGSLYFHLPFCRKKCPYCHFFVVLDDEAAKNALLRALEKELLWWRTTYQQWKLSSLYFGGGTPSLFGPGRIATLIEKLPSAGAEITLEANPDDITEDKMRAYASVGVNRVSIGVQSFHDEQLRMLGRTHSAQDACRAVEAVYRAGIENISIDLMYELPDQTLSQWRESLSVASSLPISHLSIYNLTLEPGTPFHRKREKLVPRLPSEKVATAMYESIQDCLPDFTQYEISAFAREGKRSRHNCGYWTGIPFLGLGPSAFSYFQGWRFSNVANMPTYLQAVEKGVSPVQFREKLSEEGRYREMLAVGIRLKEGVAIGTLPYRELQRELLALEKEGLITGSAEGQLRLTSKGILMYDSVAERIIL